MWEILQNNWQQLLIGQYPQGELGGIALTLILSLLGLGISFPLSILLALCRISSHRFLRLPAIIIVNFVRGMPLVMLIFWSYFLIPMVVGHSISGFLTLLCTLIVYEAAYLSEVVRAGIESLPQGQTEASRALGLSYSKTMQKVILPQAIYNMTPSLLSQFVSTIKETSLGYVISVQELTFSANQLNTQLLTRPFEVFALLALIYFSVCFLLTQGSQLIERRITAQRSGTRTVYRSGANDRIFQRE